MVMIIFSIVCDFIGDDIFTFNQNPPYTPALIKPYDVWAIKQKKNASLNVSNSKYFPKYMIHICFLSIYKNLETVLLDPSLALEPSKNSLCTSFSLATPIHQIL